MTNAELTALAESYAGAEGRVLFDGTTYCIMSAYLAGAKRVRDHLAARQAKTDRLVKALDRYIDQESYQNFDILILALAEYRSEE